jgi:hypothetical protein
MSPARSLALLPGLGVRGYVVEAQRLEIQTRFLLGRVVAIEAIATNDGRLLLGVVANQAAAGHEPARQRCGEE